MGRNAGRMSNEGFPLYAYLTFHVRREKVGRFCKAAATLISESSEEDCANITLHCELAWARSVSRQDCVLFIMFQEWTTPALLDAHMSSFCAEQFNEKLVSEEMLLVEPSTSLFRQPMNNSELTSSLVQDVGVVNSLGSHRRSTSRPKSRSILSKSGE